MACSARVPVGEEAMPGVRLAQVAFDHVVLQRPGGPWCYAWPGRGRRRRLLPATLRFRLSEAGGVPAFGGARAEGRSAGPVAGRPIVAVEGVAVVTPAPRHGEAAMQSGRAVG
jgi:general secretion pathway protein C